MTINASSKSAMRLGAGMTLMFLVAACSIGPPRPTPSPLPEATLRVGYAATHGTFYMSPGQTLLVDLPNAFSHASGVLTEIGRYPNATVFKASVLGRTTVIAPISVQCSIECNPPANFEIIVVVVSDHDLQNGLMISEQDYVSSADLSRLTIHVRSGQRFDLSLRNRPGATAWGRFATADPAIILPDQPAVLSATGLEGWFRAGKPGRTGVWATGTDCPAGNPCPQYPYAEFTFEVFV